MDATGERFSESELLSFKGRVLMSGDSPDPSAAIAAFEKAAGAAQAQNAKLLELRAATRLAVHQRAIGAVCTANERVASLCRWFAPGSQTPDVVRARAFVGSLRS